MVITKRLRLRKFKEDDLEELYDYRNNDSCNKYQRYDDTSKEYLNNFIKVNKSSEFLLEEEQHFAIALRTGELIGDLSIYFNNNTITIGYTISYKYQRTNKIQNERYFHHRSLSFFFQPNHIKSTYLSPHFNLSLILFQLISHDFSDSIPLPYLHPAVLYR